MANYASLWTSGSDKEFRQMSQFDSLQRRRLGLQMAAIQREHARHVKRVRVEIREAGTLRRQLEEEKEQRARHLLGTFSKVQKRRQATHDWRSAHQRRLSSVGAPSLTFDVQIGDEDAPWGGVRGRRDSQLSTSSRRNSSGSSVAALSTPRPSLASVLGPKTVTISPHLPHNPGRSASLKRLPPIARQETGERTGEQAASRNKRGQRAASSGPVADRCGGRGPVARRQVFFTQTFPFVYHSVGEAVCPRYKLFLQYEQFKVDPLHHNTNAHRRKSRTSVLSLSPSANDRRASSSSSPSPSSGRRPSWLRADRASFRTVGRAVGVAGIFGSFVGGQSDM